MIRTAVKVDGIRMVVQDSTDGKNTRVTPDAPHSQYAIQRSDVKAELTAIKHVADHIRSVSGPLRSVLEVFGGSGWHSALIDRACRPVRHVAWDYAEDCVASIKLSMPDIEAVQTDSYNTILSASQWIHCDFNNLTFNRYQSQPKTQALVRAAAAHAEEWLTLTDSALFGLVRFVKNRESYAAASPGIVENFWRYYDIWDDAVSHVPNAGKLPLIPLRLVGVYTWSSMAAMMLFRRQIHPINYWINKVEPSIEVKVIGPA